MLLKKIIGTSARDESIETPTEYVKIIQAARNSPFIMVDGFVRLYLN